MTSPAPQGRSARLALFTLTGLLGVALGACEQPSNSYKSTYMPAQGDGDGDGDDEDESSDEDTDDEDEDDPRTVDSGPPEPECENLECQLDACPTGKTTTLSGTAFAPNGTLPLYNVIAFVPNAELEPFEETVTCDQCGAGVTGKPLSTALSDATGKFKLENVPSGKNIPLVMQVGKWRRRVLIPEIKACQDNAVSDPNLTRLPKNRTEGDMPNIAVTLGSCDAIACLLPKLGIDSIEYGVSGQDRAVTFFSNDALNWGVAPPPLDDAGVPTAPVDGPKWNQVQPTAALWDHLEELRKYDLTVFSCECSESPTQNPTSWKAVADYLNAGGRIFTTDFQYTWYKNSPDAKLKATGVYPGGAPAGDSKLKLATEFPKGKALADWLHYVFPSTVDPVTGASTSSVYGQVNINPTFANIEKVDPNLVQTWATSSTWVQDPGMPGTWPWDPWVYPPPREIEAPRFITINTPAGLAPDKQCGKAVHLDAHINNTGDVISSDYPAGCVSKFSEAEAAFAYFFFDLASCVQQESEPPKPPPATGGGKGDI